MNLSDNFKKFMGMVGENAKQLHKDLTWTPLPSGPDVWEQGKQNGDNIKEDLKRKSAEMAMDITPLGGVAATTKNIAEEFFGMHKSTELGDIVLTKSAKNPGKFQMTMFDGRLGSSNTVKDMQFDTKEEAMKAFEELQ